MRIEKKRLPLHYKLVLLLGGWRGMVGVFVPVAILIFFMGGFFGISMNKVNTWLDLRKDSAFSQGTVTAVFKTNFTIGEDPVYEVNYEFEAPQGVYSSVGYSRSSDWEVGDELTIQYYPLEPSSCKADELMISKGGTFSWGTSGLLVFVIISSLVKNFRKGFKEIRLVQNARYLKGKLIEKEKDWVNETTEFFFTFEYEVEGKKYTHKFKSGSQERISNVENGEEWMCVSWNNPRKALVIDELPAVVQRYVKSNWCG